MVPTKWEMTCPFRWKPSCQVPRRELEPRGVRVLEAQRGVREHQEIWQVQADDPPGIDRHIERAAAGVVPSKVEVQFGIPRDRDVLPHVGQPDRGINLPAVVPGTRIPFGPFLIPVKIHKRIPIPGQIGSPATAVEHDGAASPDLDPGRRGEIDPQAGHLAARIELPLLLQSPEKQLQLHRAQQIGEDPRQRELVRRAQPNHVHGQGVVRGNHGSVEAGPPPERLPSHDQLHGTAPRLQVPLDQLAPVGIFPDLVLGLNVAGQHPAYLEP